MVQTISLEDVTLFPADGSDDALNLDYGAPGADTLPTGILAAAAQHHFSRPEAVHSLQYGPMLGDMRFRRQLAEFLTLEYGDHPVNPEHLYVTNGSSQSFFNIISIFTHKDTAIFVENPTYYMAIQVFEDHGIPRSDLVGIPLDNDGICIDILRKKLETHAMSMTQNKRVDESPCDQTRQDGGDGDGTVASKRFPFLLYLVPTFSNPTGTTLTMQRRRELVALAREYDMLVVCDDVYQFLAFPQHDMRVGHGDNVDGDVKPSWPTRLVALDPELDSSGDASRIGNIISNGSFSKFLAPGMRLGWIEAPRGILRQYERSGLMYSGGGLNHMMSTILLSAFELGLVRPHLRRVRDVYAGRCNALCRALRENMPVNHHRGAPMCTFTEPNGGFFVWMRVDGLPHGLTTTHIHAFLNAHQNNNGDQAVSDPAHPALVNITPERVSFTPGNAFSPDATHGNWLRLTFAMYNEEKLVEAAKRLARVFSQLLVHNLSSSPASLTA